MLQKRTFAKRKARLAKCVEPGAPLHRWSVNVVAGGLLCVGTLHAPQLAARDGVLEEVIVTAQLREENLQDVPVSVNAISGDKLMSAAIDKIADLQAYVPNLTMSETGIGTNIYIRGIGSGINQGFEQSAGMYVDGVAFNRAQLSRAPFLDLARVEVLRGPQNILFGKNSIAGAVSLTTHKPTDRLEGMVSGFYAPKHGEKVGDAVLNMPLGPTVAARLAYRNRTTDGYIENLLTGDDEPQRDEETYRLTFSLRPADDLRFTLKYEASEFDVVGRQMEITDEAPAASGPFAGLTYAQVLVGVLGQDPRLLNNYQDYRRTANGDRSDNNTENVTFTMDYALGEYDLTVIGAYMDYSYKEDCDCDFTGATIFTLMSAEKYDQTSLEVRLASPTGNTFETISGLYYQQSDLQFNDRFYTPPNSLLVPLVPAPFGPLLGNKSMPRDFDQDSDTYAVFTQVTWNVTDTLRFDLGLRYSQEKKEASRVLDAQTYDGQPLNPTLKSQVELAYLQIFGYETHSIDGKRTDRNLAPQVSVEWNATDDAMLYASLARGSKSGGFDVRSNADPRTSGFRAPVAPIPAPVPIPVGTWEFEDETATSLEVGAKTVLLNGAAELNVALFYTEYDDLQVSIYDGNVGFNVGNAAQAETYGLELDGRWMITESLILSGALSVIDFEFTDFNDGQCYTGEPDPNGDKLCSRDGASNQYVADWSGNVSLDHVLSLGNALEFRSGLDVIFSDDYNPSQSLDPRLDQSGYVKFNARIALADADGSWEVAVIGRNLTNEEIMTYGAPTPLAYTTFATPSYYTFWERDRSVAMQATYRF